MIGCKADDVQISDEETGWGSREWTATCHGKRFTCSSFAAGEDAVQTSCAPMSEGYASAKSGPSPGSPSSPGGGTAGSSGTGAGKAERSFDEGRQLHVVKAAFSVGAGIDLKLVGVPQASLGPIGITLTGKSWKASLNECKSMEIVVNNQPLAPSGFSAGRRADGGFVLDGSVDFQALKSLSQTYSTLGLRACKEHFTVSNKQMPELKKFLVMYSEVAMQVQKGELPKQDAAAPAQSPSEAAEAPPAAAPVEM